MITYPSPLLQSFPNIYSQFGCKIHRMNASNSHSVCNMTTVEGITDIPDEILIEIISYLNARERVPLGDSCKRFHNLVFKEKTLLRNLDFSEEGYLTSASDIVKYFSDENSHDHILKLNLRNTNTIQSWGVLFDHISKAINLVDLDLCGIKATDTRLLVEFLKALPRVRRLSIDWTGAEVSVSRDCCYKGLQEQFSKLTYLSVRLRYLNHSKELYQAVNMSQELKELHITVMWPKAALHHTALNIELKNLEIVQYYGPSTRIVAEHFVSILSHPEEWTHFQLSDPVTDMDGFHLERNVEVCEELLRSKSLQRLSYNYPHFASKLGGFVVPACLLREVMMIRQRNVAEKFCCFSSAINEDEGQLSLPSVLQISKLWLLKIEETKRLLKDPRYQISYLDISHNIEQECDAHIVASAFPSLTELVLSNVTINKYETVHLDRRTKRSATRHESGDVANLDSSFSKLVESTPRLRNLTVIAGRSQVGGDKMWDLMALPLIARWKNLTTLRLWHIPIVDGKFLIEIGKHCRHLKKIDLHDLGPSHTCCYASEVLQMLCYCSYLTDFTLRQSNIGILSGLLLRLADNPRLKSVFIEGRCQDETAMFLSVIIGWLTGRCSKLTSFVCSIGMSQTELNDLDPSLRRLMSAREYRKIFMDVS